MKIFAVSNLFILNLFVNPRDQRTLTCLENVPWLKGKIHKKCRPQIG